MRRTLLAVLSALSLLSVLRCHEKGPVAILFTGDERGYLVPAG